MADRRRPFTVALSDAEIEACKAAGHESVGGYLRGLMHADLGIGVPDLECTIYALVFAASSAIYVGKSINPRDRLDQHRAAFASGRHTKRMMAAWTQDGGFEYRVIETCAEEDSKSREMHWIRYYGDSEEWISLNTVTPIGGNGARTIGVRLTPEQEAWCTRGGLSAGAYLRNLLSDDMSDDERGAPAVPLRERQLTQEERTRPQTGCLITSRPREPQPLMTTAEWLARERARDAARLALQRVAVPSCDVEDQPDPA